MIHTRRPGMGLWRLAPVAIVALMSPAAFGQEGARTIAPGGLWGLFLQSFDAFSVVLITGSIAAVAIIVRCVLDVRSGAILPGPSLDTISGLVKAGRARELHEFTRTDSSFVARVVRAALDRSLASGAGGSTRESMREAAELAASEECARWFRKIEPLNVIGNLGPLVGLAGTVWGMILAFTSLGQAGGQAGPADLSLGISKALFHTLLGLCLATPCLLVFGFYRGIIDRLCTRAMVLSADLVDRLPDGSAPKA